VACPRRATTCVESMGRLVGMAVWWLQFLQALKAARVHRHRARKARREMTARKAWFVL
jgi:hypothetical protein